MYQLPDRKARLVVESVTQGYYIAQFLVMPSYNSTERRKFFLSLTSFAAQRNLFQKPFY